MRAWLDVMDRVLSNGVKRPDRTGVGTLALFGEQVVFENSDTFPAVTAKRLAFSQVKYELACFLRGYDRLSLFKAVGCNIWDGNGSADYWKAKRRHDDDLGRIYGVQWRFWRGLCEARHNSSGLLEPKPVMVDQLHELVSGIRRDPYGRRHLVTAWNPAELDVMCLPPCHVMFQAFVRPGDGEGRYVLDLLVYMRSVDLFLGLPFDVASYALLQRLLCRELGEEYFGGRLVFHLGDAHVYLNHQDQVRTVLARQPKPAPQLDLHGHSSLFNFVPNDASLANYDPHPVVVAPLNV